MSSRTLNRKQFLVFTASAVATSALAACGDDPVEPGGSSGKGGSAGSGTAGSGTSGGSAGSGTSGSGGSSAGKGGSGGSAGSSAGSGGSAGKGGAGGAGGGGGSGGGGGGMCTGDIKVTSSGDHKHDLAVTAAQIAAGTEVTILSTLSGGHAHYVKITAADFTALKAGMEVVKKSCSGGDHEYVLKCGGGGKAPAAPTCNDECGGDMASSAC